MDSLAPLLGLVLLMGASMAIGIAANRATRGGGFMKGYFLGNRGLGSWSMALTATVMSGGTFMGFPSLVYKYGWSLALWIASYMVVPLCTFAVIGKRMGQVSRQTGAITVPDFFRERFGSPALGAVSSALMVFILTVSLVAQFKGGAIILQQVLPSISGISDAGWKINDKSASFVYGLAIFTLVVVSYTVYGGFLAAVWTDLFQSILMAVGVLILFPLAMMRAGGLEKATLAGMQQVGSGFAGAPGGLPDREFLPLGLALSFFCMWSIAGMGQPATLVRLMAFRNTQILRQAMLLLAVYNTLIYLPLVFIFIAARGIIPGLEKSDEVMPRLTLEIANPWVAGLILAAPFGAVMATTSAFLVQISSAITQDLFHRFIRPDAGEGLLRTVSYLGIILVALLVGVATLFAPEFLQAIIVFAGGAAACAFLAPAVMACCWRRSTAQGALAAMTAGVGVVLLLYAAGWITRRDPGIDASGSWAPLYPLQLAPFVWGLLASVAAGIAVSLATPAHPDAGRFFEDEAEPEAQPAPG